MDAYTMMSTAAILLGLAAVGGLVMAIIRFRGADRPPSSFAMGHGLIAGAALTLLIYAAATEGLPTLALASTVLFIVVALVGVYLNLRYHSKLLPLPKSTIVVHGVVAVVAYTLLLMAVVSPQ